MAKQNHEPIYPTLFFSLSRDRKELYEHLDRRVEEMFQAGLLEETLPLIKEYGESMAAFQAIGVKELIPYIHGETTLPETIDKIKLDTRHYVKRQETFFRHQFPVRYVSGEEEILSFLEESSSFLIK